MVNSFILIAILVICLLLWLQNFSLFKMVRRLERQNQNLRRRLITTENYLFGTHPDDREFWEAIG